MGGKHIGKFSEVDLAEAVVLHRQFLQVRVVGKDAHNFIDGVTRELVPGDVKEDKLAVVYPLEHIAEDLLADLAVIQAKDLQHRVLVYHGNDALCQVSGYHVVAEVKGVQLPESLDGVDDRAGAIFGDFKLLHFQVLNLAQRVTK